VGPRLLKSMQITLEHAGARSAAASGDLERRIAVRALTIAYVSTGQVAKEGERP
jgi:hypothetical protein